MRHDTPTQNIALEQAVSGMVLQADVSNKSGRVLLPAGTALTERHLQLLSANGVDRLAIQSGASTGEKKEKSPLSAEEIASTLENRFRDNNPDHPVIKELTRICRARMEAEQ